MVWMLLGLPAPLLQFCMAGVNRDGQEVATGEEQCNQLQMALNTTVRSLFWGRAVVSHSLQDFQQGHDVTNFIF